jgi:regulator of sigma E protease
MEALIMAGQLILGLSILVGLHELGHLVAAKVFGMRVEQYSIGFPPKLFGFKYGETEYSLGAVPLGGFVKISGMVDESLDTDKLSEEPKPWEFRSKPAWQRLIVMMGGIVVNVITGVIIFIAIVYITGERYLPASEAKYGIVAYDLAKQIGLRSGDKIIKINGKTFTDFDEVSSSKVFLGSNSYYTIEREGKLINIPIPNDFIEKLSDRKSAGQFLAPNGPFKVYRIEPGQPADKAGLKPEDKIIQVNQKPIHVFSDLQQVFSENKGKPITVKVLRDGKEVELKSALTPDGKFGFNHELLLKEATIKYSFGEAVVKGTDKAFGVVFDNIKAFGKIFRGEVSATKSLSGPIGIAQIFGGTWVWERFWYITGLLSMILAFMNFLPIPALDGGHVMFLMYEMVSGRSPSDKFLEVAQKVGMVILLSLMVFAIANDTFKLFSNF